MQYTTIYNVLRYLTPSSKLITCLSLVCKDMYETITKDEYNLLWNWYTNHHPQCTHYISWIRIADMLVNNSINVKTSTSSRRKHTVKYELATLNPNRIQYISMTSSNRINIEYGNIKYSIVAKPLDIITIITDIPHGVIYFFMNNNIKRFHIENDKSIVNVRITSNLPPNVVLDKNIISNIINDYGDEIFNCQLLPHEHVDNIGLHVDHLLHNSNIGMVEHLIKYNRFTMEKLIEANRVRRILYSGNRQIIEYIMKYCNTKDYRYSLEGLLSNIKSMDELYWLLEHVNTDNLMLDSHCPNYINKLQEYHSILSSSKHKIYYRPSLVHAINKENMHYINIPMRINIYDVHTHEDIHDIVCAHSIPYIYSYGLFKTIKDEVIIRDGIDIGHSIRSNQCRIGNVIEILHKNGEYNIVIDEVIYYTIEPKYVSYVISTSKNRPLLKGNLDVFLSQISRDRSGIYSSTNYVRDIIREINLRIINDNTHIDDILSRLTNIDNARFDIHEEELPDCFHLIPNITHLNVSCYKITTLPSSITMLNKLKILDISNTDIETIPDSLLELHKNNPTLRINIKGTRIKTIPTQLIHNVSGGW